MDQTQQAGFDLDPAKNDFLFFARGWARFALLVLIGILALMVWFTSQLLDPSWHPHYAHGKGALIIALVVMMPVVVRVTLLVGTIGWIAERVYRMAVRAFDSKPDFAIGVSGVADLNPWTPRAIRWDEMIDIRRISSRGKPLYLQFVTRKPCPEWIPASTWDRLPGTMTERRIVISPRWIGMDDDCLCRLVESYSGRTRITERTR